MISRGETLRRWMVIPCMHIHDTQLFQIKYPNLVTQLPEKEGIVVGISLECVGHHFCPLWPVVLLVALVEGKFFKLHKDNYSAPVKYSDVVPIPNTPSSPPPGAWPKDYYWDIAGGSSPPSLPWPPGVLGPHDEVQYRQAHHHLNTFRTMYHCCAHHVGLLEKFQTALPPHSEEISMSIGSWTFSNWMLSEGIFCS